MKMVKTVEDGFSTFHSLLAPIGTESGEARRHRASIEARLKSNFQMTSFFRTGSFKLGTSIRGYSRVDYFAVIPSAILKNNSSTTLSDVQSALEKHFPFTGVRVKAPTVLVPFGTDASESTEVVPADFLRKDTNGDSIYKIPDETGGWMKSSPDAHNRWVTKVNNGLGGKVKPLIRFIKAWKYYRNVPLSSFYLELRVAKYASREDSILYPHNVREILNQLWDNELASMQDPTGISGDISPCSSDADKERSLWKLETAVSHANNAREAEQEGRLSDAFNWWNLLYDGHFPSYG